MERKQYGLSFLTDENGFLLISTLFFLLFTGLFSQSIIKISSYQIIQLRQYSSAYEAKGTLNMGEKLLIDYITENQENPSSGRLKTSTGDIEMVKESDDKYIFKITLKNGMIYFKEANISLKTENNGLKEENELLSNKEEIEE